MTRLGRHALGISLAAVLPVACGASHPIPPALYGQDNIARPKPLGASPEKVLYCFKGGSDGAGWYSDLLNVDGTLYGTTPFGGTKNGGTAFSLSPSGKKRVVYLFKGADDGRTPWAGLTDVNDRLYGTTASGGGSGSTGTVFALTTTGSELILHSFKGYPTDGAAPYATLVAIGKTLYGTTSSGGTTKLGTVFDVTTSGRERVLHSFTGGRDGSSPYGALVNVGGTLYGTTSGAYDYSSADSWGSVFSITPSGKEQVLYRFKGPPDGATPYAGLVVLKGTLYGTTTQGGSDGWGTVFSISPSGKERVLYSFKGGNDGIRPYAPLVNLNGVLYGTTQDGGGEQPNCDGCGTVFDISTVGSENVLYSFQNDPDGADVLSGLTVLNGALYGTTAGGGYGYGTIFRVAP